VYIVAHAQSEPLSTPHGAARGSFNNLPKEAPAMNEKTKKQTILVPVDFSPHSEAALSFAAGLADTTDERLIVLHVVHDPGDTPGYYSVKGRKKQLRRLEDVAVEMLEEFMRKMTKEHPEAAALAKAESQLVTGLPVTRILEMVKKYQPYMVVMGSKGRTGLAHLFLGSKAEQVVHLCPVPVTIVKARPKKT
jgi:nucleotide-binding universal stress UspA family protein